MPAAGGNGLAMRAGVFLDALARDFQVTLLVIPVAGGAIDAIPEYVASRSRRVHIVRLDGKLDPLWDLSCRLLDPTLRAAALARYPRPALCRYVTTPMRDAVAAALAGDRFAAVHVMRSYLAPYAAPALHREAVVGPALSIDLDDDEAATHDRLAALWHRLGMADEARIAAAEAAKYRQHEAQWLPRFDMLIACTDDQISRLATAVPQSRQAVVPNTVALPTPTARQRVAGSRLLFVGNLSYWPNVDGIVWFSREVLPLLRVAIADVTLRIAGGQPAPEVAGLAAIPGIEVIANPTDLGDHYAWADLAVVPIAAGGGTRIKLLEALAYGLPVVATTIGAEGIEAASGEHLVLADAAVSFADACASILADPEQAARLAANGRRLVETRYQHQLGVAAVRQAFCRLVGA